MEAGVTKTSRLTSVWRMLKQIKRKMGIYVLQKGSKPMKAEPPALPRWYDVLVIKGAATPKSCLLPVEMRTLTAAGG